jgi:wee1-like protein kinase
VFQAVHSVDGCIYAIKKTQVKSNSPKSRALALKESNVLSYLNSHGQCPYIVQYYNSFWESDMTACMQMEYCANGNVKEQHSKNRLIEADIWKLFSQISTAIKFLHDHNVAHLDVKPENMLIHANGDYRLADFGHATLIDCSNRNFVFQVDDGDRRYLAYELLQDDFRNLGAADIFSLALSILELLTDELPHSGDEWRELREGRCRRNLKCHKEFKSILTRMMVQKPAKRILPGPLLSEINRHDHLYMSD